MSRNQRTGLAKLPTAVEWLVNALGAAETREEGAGAASKFLLFAHHK